MSTSKKHETASSKKQRIARSDSDGDESDGSQGSAVIIAKQKSLQEMVDKAEKFQRSIKLLPPIDE